jgi:hypothetical protein
MAYTDTWNAAFEALPADGDNVSEGAERIRDGKVGIRERMEKDHYMDIAGTDADHGEHKWVTLREQGAAPSNVANKGFLYTKDVSGATELFYEDDDGTEIQLTNGGSINLPSDVVTFPAGTKMVFYQDTAPTGWTIQNTLDDKLLFITKGSAAGGQTGGGAHSTGTWTQPSHTLTEAEIPSHRHALMNSTNTHDEMYGAGQAGDNAGSTQYSGYTGGGGAHSHGTTWRPAAYCAIIASKN